MHITFLVFGWILVKDDSTLNTARIDNDRLPLQNLVDVMEGEIIIVTSINSLKD
jgi:hypothetical protein